MLDPNWNSRAECAPTAITVAFHFGEARYDADAARRVCARCPVAVECLDAAMRYEASNKGHYRFGIWGGLTAAERTRLSLADQRYAVYPEDFTELEVFTIFEEVIADMKVRFSHPVDGFDFGEEVDLGPDLAAHYVNSGHASSSEGVVLRPSFPEPVVEPVAEPAVEAVIEAEDAIEADVEAAVEATVSFLGD